MNICNQLNLLVSTAFKVVSSVIIWLLFINQLNAQESLCASVRIEIEQELAFERQGFDANMRITNALDNISVENVNIDVLLMDENNEPVLASSDPDNTDALFFIRLDSVSGIEDINGNGTIEPESVADIHWLIVPAPGTGGSSPQGTLYYAGASLSYTMGDEEIQIDVSPDYIYVKPMPLLTLDYFLPRDVYADDAFTAIIEPAIPFDLGVRITNNGFGVAGNVSIDSAQPKIIDNELGLLIGFVITGSSLNDQPVEPTLLIPFGDLGANEVVSGRWQMETTLSGEFVEFTAEYSHIDELGGELTSLLENVNTHQLVKNVLVDLPGRDGVRDFLAKDGDVLRVYESSGLDTTVTDQSSQATLTWSGQVVDDVVYSIQAPETDGFLYAKFTDPHSGTKQTGRFLRTDGKSIPADNVWFSQTRREDNGWDYFIHIFDVNSSGKYQLVLENKVSVPVPPVMQFIADKVVPPGTQISFLVEASDLNGTLPSLSVEPLPTGAQFYLNEEGAAGITTYIFDWTPGAEQKAIYQLMFVASDGELQTMQSVEFRVCETNDSDCDGISDKWELEYFGTLDRDGSGDFDNDGILDGIDNNPNDFDEVASTLYSGQLYVLPDMTSDDVLEIGKLRLVPELSQVTLEVLDGKNQTLLNTVTWNANYLPSTLSLHLLGDTNENGSIEAGLFGIQNGDNVAGKPQIFVRDLATGNRVNVFNWPANWKEVSAIVLPDMTEDGIGEIGIQGRFKDGNRPQLLTKDGADTSTVATFGYPDLFIDPIFSAHSDSDKDGVPEISTFGRLKQNDKVQVKIANGKDPQDRLKAYNFPDKWDNISWHELDDSNADGIQDWGLFGINKEDGRPQLINKDGSDPKGALRIFAWSADLQDAKFFSVPDMNNDGIDEVAVGGRRSNGRYQFQIQDGKDRQSVLANHNRNLKLENLSFHVLPDLNGDQKAEIGYLGQNDTGEYELVIWNGVATEGELMRHNLGIKWFEAPSVTSLGDTNNDGQPNLLIYGENTNDQLVMLAF
jgi:hypothetical protein